MIIYKVNELFWEHNESIGYRVISIEQDSRVLFMVTASTDRGTWHSKLIPMGYSFDLTEMKTCAMIFSEIPKLMELMQTESLTVDTIQQYLLQLPTD